MYTLDNTHSLTYVQAAAKTSVDGVVTVTYEDIPAGPPSGNFTLMVPNTVAVNTNGTTVVTIVPAAPKGYRRRVTQITLNNIDTGSITPKFSITDGTTPLVIFTGTRATLEQLVYAAGAWQGYSVALARQ